MNQLPEWLVAHLSAKGLHDADGVRRAARLTRCVKCNRRVLVGLDGDVAAMPVTCDPHEVDVKGEALALILGLQTYTLTRSARSKGIAWNLDHRHPWAIEKGRRTAIVAEHRCDVAVPPASMSFLPVGDRSAGRDALPPF